MKKLRGQYGVAQLSPWPLFPLDGLNLKHGTSGELFDYADPKDFMEPMYDDEEAKNSAPGAVKQ